MRILFVNPPYFKVFGGYNNWIIPGLHVLAQVVANSKRFEEVKLLNCDFDFERKPLSKWRDLLTISKDVREIADDIDHDIWVDASRKILEFNPDVVGFYANAGNFHSAVRVMQRIRKDGFTGMCVVGGPATTTMVECCHQYGFDKIFVFEQEDTFISAIETDAKIVVGSRVENLDTLPYLTKEIYIDGDKISGAEMNLMMGSRGCMGNCSFCATPFIYKQNMRFQSISRILSEIWFRNSQYGTPYIYLEDDVFTVNKKRVSDFCAGITRIDDGNIKWWVESRADQIDSEMIKGMKDAGCIRVKFGLEFASEKGLMISGKGVDLDDIKRAVSICHDADMDFTVYLLLGLPGLVEKDYRDALPFIRSLDARFYTVGVTAPYPGTSIYRNAVEKMGLEKYNHVPFAWSHMSYEMLKLWGLSEELVSEYMALNDGPEHYKEFRVLEKHIAEMKPCE